MESLAAAFFQDHIKTNGLPLKFVAHAPLQHWGQTKVGFALFAPGDKDPMAI